MTRVRAVPLNGPVREIEAASHLAKELLPQLVQVVRLYLHHDLHRNRECPPLRGLWPGCLSNKTDSGSQPQIEYLIFDF